MTRADDLPIDPDVDAPFAGIRRRRGGTFALDIIAVIFVGGCLGGWARYAVSKAWPTPTHHFPWAIFTVNEVGAFVLAATVVIAAEVVPSRYLRPLVGTGFCGALTTFSSVVVGADQLFAHKHVATGIAYLVASIVGGLAAGMIGLVCARSVARRRRRPLEGSPS